MKTSIDSAALEEIFKKLSDANTAFNRMYPGESPARQPVHTVYGGAHLFKSDSAVKLGQLALKALEEYAPDYVTLGKALKLPGYELLPESGEKIARLEPLLDENPAGVRAERHPAWLAYTVYHRVVEKLKREPVEDFRIDFEDGYGNRPDNEEDEHARLAAEEVAKGMNEKTLPPFIGIRIKPFTEELKARSARTLDIFLTTLVKASAKKLPDNFVVTLPKVQIPEQVTALVRMLEILEKKFSLESGSLKLELMVETPQSIINSRGEVALPGLVRAAEGRCVACHFGVYDYTASSNITAAYQSMDHPSCDFAREAMRVSLSGTGIWLSDGATNVMPVGPNRPGPDGKMSKELRDENIEIVHRAWKLGYDHIRHSLKHAFYQGWDLHPAQLPIRYAACYCFFLESLEPASLRLRSFIEKAAQATLVGDVFDDAATGQGLLNFFLRAMNCGAINKDELKTTGLTIEEISTRSFVKILARRREGVLA
ncbi:MAG TPA: hypothetical protein V6D17_15825 [Candidatus Obscuribacterales bacterium]